MAHELLLLAGSDHPLERHARAALVNHAAIAVPGAVSHRFAETRHAVIALVETSPAGGDDAEMDDCPGAVRVHVATTERGLQVARRGAADSVVVGAEAGHVRLVAAEDGSVDLSTDGMAFLPCFWAEHGERLHASTHLASLVSLGLPAEEDTAGLVQYLVMLHPLQQRTLLRHGRLLPPGGRLRWDPKSSARLTGRPVFVPSDLAMADDKALETFRDLWSTVIQDLFDRNAGHRTVLGLSGGLDSRGIAAGSAGLDIHPLSYTYGDQSSADTVVAIRVARRLKLPHLTIPVTDDRLLADADGIAARLDGAHGPAEMYETWFADLLRSFADVVVNGAGGGPLWGDDKAVGLLGAGVVLERVFGRYAAEAAAVAPFLTTLEEQDVADALRSGLADSMSEWDFSARTDMAVYWRLANRQLRWGNMLGSALRRAGLRLEAPFLDSRFLHFAARLSPEQRVNGSLHLRVQREVFRRTADIERSDDGNSPDTVSHLYWSGDRSYVSQLAALARRHPIAGARRASRRSLKVGAEVLRRRGLTGPSERLAGRASVFPADAWIRTRRTYAERLASLVSGASRAHPLLCEESMHRAAAAIRAGDPTAPALTLGKLATVGLWLTDYSTRATAVAQLETLPSPGP